MRIAFFFPNSTTPKQSDQSTEKHMYTHNSIHYTVPSMRM